MSIVAPQIVIKHSGESLLLSMDFAELLEAGETISSITNITVLPLGPTLGAGAISGSEVRFRASGGAAGASYEVTVTIVTSAGNTRISVGRIKVPR